MASDRITEIRVRGMRCLADVRLPLGGLTVLIGENGSGKSTLLEALELLRKAGAPDFLDALYAQHQGLGGLLRQGAGELALGLTTVGSDGDMSYELALAADGNRVVVSRESFTLRRRARPIEVIRRDRSAAAVFDQRQKKLVAVDDIPPGRLLVSAFGMAPPQPALARMCTVLQGIDVHLPFDVVAQWGAVAAQRTSPLRAPSLLQTTEELGRLGANLASAWHTLRNDRSREHWEETLDWVRLGLGYEVTDVVTTARHVGGPGQITLALADRRLAEPIPAAGLSDGMLSYLALVALCRLNTSKSLIACDEPDDHLHPALLARAVQLFERLAETVPVVLATHSDRLLDALADPVASTVRCALDERASTRLYWSDAADFARWREHYAGLGAMRAAGLEPVVVSKEAPG